MRGTQKVMYSSPERGSMVCFRGVRYLPNAFDVVLVNAWLHTFLTILHEMRIHTKLSVINRRVPGWDTDSPCGVWGRGWTTCLLYGGPPLGLYIQRQLVCKISIVEENLILISFLLYYLSNNFHPKVAFYTKYIVLSYSIAVVSALSNKELLTLEKETYNVIIYSR